MRCLLMLIIQQTSKSKYVNGYFVYKAGEQAEQVPEKAMMILNAKMNEYLAEFDPAKKAVDAAKNVVK